MLHFEGDKDFTQPPAEVWTRLTDARFLIQCVPDLRKVSKAEPREAVCTVKPSVGFVSGSLDVTLQVVDLQEPSSARYVLQSKGIGTSNTVEVRMEMGPRDGGGTHVHWAADVTQLGGLLKMVPQGLIQASAQKVIGDVWTAAEARMSTP
jgi:carbon monoxide dehydrogenase subunit G